MSLGQSLKVALEKKTKHFKGATVMCCADVSEMCVCVCVCVQLINSGISMHRPWQKQHHQTQLQQEERN